MPHVCSSDHSLDQAIWVYNARILLTKQSFLSLRRRSFCSLRSSLFFVISANRLLNCSNCTLVTLYVSICSFNLCIAEAISCSTLHRMLVIPLVAFAVSLVLLQVRCFVVIHCLGRLDFIGSSRRSCEWFQTPNTPPHVHFSFIVRHWDRSL
jgi:hypothetical protein